MGLKVLCTNIKNGTFAALCPWGLTLYNKNDTQSVVFGRYCLITRLSLWKVDHVKMHSTRRLRKVLWASPCYSKSRHRWRSIWFHPDVKTGRYIGGRVSRFIYYRVVVFPALRTIDWHYCGINKKAFHICARTHTRARALSHWPSPSLPHPLCPSLKHQWTSLTELSLMHTRRARECFGSLFCTVEAK